jgi:hypothetical protein
MTVSERAALGGQVLDPLGWFRDLLPRGQGELGALRLGGGRGFGGAQRRVLPGGVPTAEFGVGSDSQVPLGSGGGVPVGPVGHDGGKSGCAVPVGIMHGPVAAGQGLLPGGFFGLAAALGGSASAVARTAARRASQAAARTWIAEPDRFTVAVAGSGHPIPVLGAVARPYRRRLAVVVILAFAVSVITGPANSFVFLFAQNVLH